MYAHRCEECGGYHYENLADDDDTWSDIYEQIAAQLLSTEDVKINADLHLKTAKKLIDAVDKAATDSELGKPDPSLIRTLKTNIYPFSAAKSFQQMIYYRNMMHNKATGRIESKDSFIKKIAGTGEIFNKTHLTTEYENAYYSTLMADKWNRFADDEILEYSTVGDRNVRPSHAILDKYTAPKSDIFWRKNYPPNGWNCRCTVVPGKANHQNRLTPQEAGRQLKAENKDTPFWNNVGESKLIFQDKHPYFLNSNGKETNLSWEQYGLPNLDKMRAAELPEYKVTTKDEYFDWWKNKSKGNEHLVLKDGLGNEITFESSDKGKDFKNHILQKAKDKRYEYATELESILKTPDEIWMNPKDKNTISYLKFYENGAIRVVVNNDWKGETMYLIEKDNPAVKNKIGETRKGILLYR